MNAHQTSQTEENAVKFSETIKRHGVVLFGAAALAAMWVGTATAETESAADAADERGLIEEIIVTATYRETSLMDTAVSISAVDADAIEQLGATDVLGLYRALPGVNAAGGPTGSNRIAIRGVTSQTGQTSTRQTAATVAVYVDQTPMTSALGPIRQFGGSLFDVQRVEVLKGPQGTLFGEGSQGGTVRYIYNEPDPSGLDYRVQVAGFLQNESGDSSYRVDGMVNIPLAENFAVRLLAFHDDAAGWIDKNNVTPAEEDINSVRSTGGRISAKWWPTERFTATASILIVDSYQDSSAIAYEPYEENLNPRVTQNPASSEDEVNLFSLRLDYDFGFATLTSVTSYLDRFARRMWEIDPGAVLFLDAVYGYLINLPHLLAGNPLPSPCTPYTPEAGPYSFWGFCPAGDMRSMSAYGLDSQADTERFIQEVRLVSNTDGPLLWTAGIFFKTSDDLRRDQQLGNWNPGREWIEQLWLPYMNSPPIVQGFDPNETYLNTFDEISGFGEATYALTDALSITAGARVSNLKQRFDWGGYKIEDTVVSPKATLSWQPTDDQLFYFRYASGYRQGGVNNTIEFNRRNTSVDGVTPPEHQELFLRALLFDGDKLENFELGAKLSLADGRAQVIAAAYYQKWTDMITTVWDPELAVLAIPQYNDNVGDAHSQGIELEFNWELVDGLLLRLAGDINESETDEDIVQSSSYQVPKNSKLIYAPKWSLSASVDYRFNLPADLEGRLRVDHQRVAKQFIQPPNDLSMPKYDLTSLRFSISSQTDRRWTASIFVDNVFDDVVILDKVNRRSFGGMVSNVYARPRIIGLQVSFGSGN
jgi:iron complex outermembrane receptor protein